MMGWVWFALTIVAGIFAYWLRCNHRRVYGWSEIGVGILLMYLAYYPHTHNMLFAESTWYDDLLRMSVAIFAGIYAFVRGLTNVFEERS